MLRALLLLLVGTTACLAGPVKFGAVDAEGWRLIRMLQGYPIEQRAVAHSRFPQTRIRALIPAAPATVYQVISDYDHFSEFVPNVLDSRSISRAHGAHRVFQRLHFAGPLADLRYVIWVEDQIDPAGPGSYRVEWGLEPTQDIVDDLSGFVPQSFSGYWELKPAQNGAFTDAVYSIRMDPGGYWPAWLITPAINRYLSQVVVAITRRVKDTEP